MTPRELVELLNNLAAVINRMPLDVPLKELQRIERPLDGADAIAGKVRRDREQTPPSDIDLPDWTQPAE